MDFSDKPRNSTRRMVGIGAVVALHAVLGYGLVSGLARKAIDIVKKPLETKIVEEVKLPPPPPPPPPPPKEVPKLPPPPAAAPPPYVPPPEITPPPVSAPPVISQTTTTVPVAPPVIAPPPPPAPPAPVAAPPAPPPKPLIRRGVTPTKQARPDYPRKALQDEIEGEVIARANVSKQGKVVSVTIVSAKPRGVFERSVEYALRQYEFPPDDTEYIVEVPFTFRLE